VRFYYIYKSLAHPEREGYVQPYTLEERLRHVQHAEKRLGGTIPWLCDTMANEAMHALGNAPTSEFVIDPEGRIVRKRAWGNPELLRADLAELVGPVENPTSADDVKLAIQPAQRPAESGVVERLQVPETMKPLVVRPQGLDGDPFYMKLRADGDEQLVTTGSGKLYLGFFVDPLYDFHWNNGTDPIHVELTGPSGTTLPASLDGPRVEVAADVDPREFLIDLADWPADQTIRVTVRYFACNDVEELCLAVEQRYEIERVLDQDSGWVRGRIDPAGVFDPPPQRSGPQTPQRLLAGRIEGIDADAGEVTVALRNGTTRTVRVTDETEFESVSVRKNVGELQVGDQIRLEVTTMPDEGLVVTKLRARGRPGGRQ